MNLELIRRFFPEKAALIAEGKCPECKQPRIAWPPFRDELSRTEASISGLCQNCQDLIFPTLDQGGGDTLLADLRAVFDRDKKRKRTS